MKGPGSHSPLFRTPWDRLVFLGLMVSPRLIPIDLPISLTLTPETPHYFLHSKFVFGFLSCLYNAYLRFWFVSSFSDFHQLFLSLGWSYVPCYWLLMYDPFIQLPPCCACLFHVAIHCIQPIPGLQCKPRVCITQLY